jgi:hypothetical protein
MAKAQVTHLGNRSSQQSPTGSLLLFKKQAGKDKI